uniref:Glutathione Stransferase putative n=1 Tax=Albugo laibachii Nc14 TaxID=890382 RepID=F0W3L0_9STRA|nr:glutathione Stransferase putative [Albugo laibachii Nc14]CCA16285.1 glutathione Stransferase putative [Albugo laibachii Nc14]|eukprot:CCA16285.1 glutathione Stransferase putative [Albugo laibachii Nc14]
MSPPLKLVYFDAKGRGEFARLCFAYGKIPFEDKRVTKEEFGALKPKLPLGQVPVLYVGETPFPESGAIARYAAKLAGLYPDDPCEMVKVEATMGAFQELVTPVVQIVYFNLDESAKAAKTKEVLEVLVPKTFTWCESITGEKYLLGNKISIADVAIYDIVVNFLNQIPGFTASKYPKVEGITKHVKAEPTIAAYLSKSS